MADLQLLDCFQPELVRLERVRFFQRQLLTVADMVTEQDYIRQKLRRHNRFLHGWGVVCGLEVIPQPTGDAPWRVEITAGYALGPYGDEVYVGESVFLDLAQCGPDALTSPCEPDVLEGPSEVSGGTLYVAIKFAECVTSRSAPCRRGARATTSRASTPASGTASSSRVSRSCRHRQRLRCCATSSPRAACRRARPARRNRGSSWRR